MVNTRALLLTGSYLGYSDGPTKSALYDSSKCYVTFIVQSCPAKDRIWVLWFFKPPNQDVIVMWCISIRLAPFSIFYTSCQKIYWPQVFISNKAEEYHNFNRQIKLEWPSFLMQIRRSGSPPTAKGRGGQLQLKQERKTHHPEENSVCEWCVLLYGW